MQQPLTIAYFTCRHDPKIQWFFNSLNRELKGDWSNIKIMIIDYYHQYEPQEREDTFKSLYEKYTSNVLHISPKPSPWQGIHRKTTKEYFAASSARNTAFAYCDTDYIVCIDDLTVLQEGWLDAVRWGQENNKVIYGAYAKAHGLTCQEEGSYSYENKPLNLDSRFNQVKGKEPHRVAGSWLFGCSFGLPLNLAIQADGFDESCDGQGAEDYDFGIRLGRLTTEIYYCKKMFTYENEELHHVPGNQHFVRASKMITENGTLKSKKGIMSDHAKLQQVMESNSHLPHHLTDLENLREIVKRGEEIQPSLITLDWRDGQPLSEM